MAYKKLESVSDSFWENDVNPVSKMLIEDYLNQQQHLSKQTLKQYESALRIFARWLHDSNMNKAVTDLRPRDGLRYQNYLISLGMGASAIKFKRSVVSSLCQYIEVYYDDEYKNFRNIFSKAVPTVASTKVKTKVVLTAKDIKKIEKALIKKKEWQKLAYFMYTYETGCRREESRQVRKEVANYDLFVNSESVQKNYYVTHEIRAKGKGKEGKVRVFKFNQSMKYIKLWMEQREQLVKENKIKDDCEFLFVRITKTGVTQIPQTSFNDWCNEFGLIVDKHVHPHLIRSSRATIAVVEEGKDIKTVQQLLGHAKSDTTEIYVVRPPTEDDDELF